MRDGYIDLICTWFLYLIGQWFKWYQCTPCCVDAASSLLCRRCLGPEVFVCIYSWWRSTPLAGSCRCRSSRSLRSLSATSLGPPAASLQTVIPLSKQSVVWPCKYRPQLRGGALSPSCHLKVFFLTPGELSCVESVRGGWAQLTLWRT